MKTLRLVAVISCICLLANALEAQQCSDYLKDKNRQEYLKHSVRVSGLGAMLATNTGSTTIWVTDWFARGLVCTKIERERLSDEEGAAAYKEMRPEGKYTFLILTRYYNAGQPGGRASTMLDTLKKNELFLQRANDKTNFLKGEVADWDYDVDLSAFGGAENTYIVTFPKLNRNGQPVIKGMDDRIEVQYSLGSKRVVLEFKVKEITGRLEEL